MIINCQSLHLLQEKKNSVYAAYPGWVLLQGSQVALQSQAAAVVKQSLHSGHVGLHQLLALTGRLLLQCLNLLLETLQGGTYTERLEGSKNLGRFCIHLHVCCELYLNDSLLVSTWKILGFPLSLLPLSHHLSMRKTQITLFSPLGGTSHCSLWNTSKLPTDI